MWEWPGDEAKYCSSTLYMHGSIVVAHSTCMAGLAEACSHVSAILH